MANMIDLAGYIATIELDTDQFNTSLDNVDSQAQNKIGGLSTWMKVTIGAGIAAIGAGIVSVGSHMVNFGNDYNNAMNQLQASTGASEKEMESLGQTAQNVFKHGFGENIEDVVESLATVQKSTGLVGEELEKATESSLALRDVFGFEIEESTRAVSALMKQFGVDSSTAYDIIAKGAQEGANQNGDLLDTINEYSNQYANLGLSADEFITSLVTGAENGVFSIDKVGDAVKEFGIRASDGSKSTIEAFQSIGLNADEMGLKFASGGEQAREATFEVIKALENMENPMLKNQASVALFGTMYEDLGSNILPILGSMEDSTISTGDAMAKINEVKYDDIGTALETLMRGFEVSFLPVATNVVNYILDAMPTIENVMGTTFDVIGNIINGFVDTLNWLVENIGGFVSDNEDSFNSVKETIVSVVSSIQEFIVAFIEFITKLWDLWGQDILTYTSKYFELIKVFIDSTLNIIKGIFNMFTALLKGDWESFGQALLIITQNFFTLIQNTWNLAIEAIKLLFTLAIDALKIIATNIMQGIWDAFISVWDSITTWFDTSLNTLFTWFDGLYDSFFDIGESLFEGIWDGLKSIWSDLSSWISDKVSWILDKLSIWNSSKSKMSSSSVSSPSTGGSPSSLIPKLATGTPLIQSEGLAYLHKGESVIPASVNPWNSQNKKDLLSGGNTENHYHISKLEFPNVRNSDDIREAILNLPRRALQHYR